MNGIGKEYGDALFMLALEEDRAKEYGDALQAIQAAFFKNPEYSQLLASPDVSLRERIAVIDAVYAKSVPQHVLSFVKLLCEKGRISCFEAAYGEYMAQFYASQRVINAKITSAVVLTDAEKAKLIRKLEVTHKGKVQAEYLVDKELLGGMMVEIDGKILDGSLRHRLREMKDVMHS